MEAAAAPEAEAAPSPKRPRLAAAGGGGPGCGAAAAAEEAAPGDPQTPPAGAPGRAAPLLTPEQRERIERSRRLALERRQQGGGGGDASEEKKPEASQGPVATAEGLTAEQRSRIERSRLAALERRRAETAAAAAAAAAGLSPEQLAQIERNRLAAMERRRQQDQQPATAGLVKTEVAAPGAGEAAPASPAPSTPDLPPVPVSPSLDSVSLSSSSSSSSCSSPRRSAPASPRSPEEPGSDSSSECSSESEDEADQVDGAPSESEAELGVKTEPAVEADKSTPASEVAAPNASAEKDPAVSAPRPAFTAAVGRCRADVPASKPVPKERTAKQTLVAQLLCRWWYALPDWPPEDFDYEAALHAHGFRRVAVERFHLEPEQDVHGREKVFAVPGWLGLFRSGFGQLVDMRPVEGRPSYDQLMLRSTSELRSLVVTAYEKQLEALEAHPCQGPQAAEQREELRRQVAKVKRTTSFWQPFFGKSGGAEVGKDS